MSTHKPIFLLSLLTIVLTTSCAGGSWGYYSKIDRERAHANGLPYWEDIFKECFPHTHSSKTINRIAMPRLFHMASPPLVAYHTATSHIKFDPDNPPDEFAGYMAHLVYIPDRSADDQLPVVMWMIFSEYGVKKEHETIEKASKVDNLTVGEFTFFKAKLKEGDFGYAFYDDYFCIGCVLGDGFDGKVAKWFESFLMQLDMECIKGQCP